MASTVPVTLIIPAHNAARYLRRTLPVICSQLQPDWQFILTDDGSTDDTAALAQAAGAHVLRHTHTQGPAAARNHAIQHAHGEILLFLDADVLPHADTLTRLHETLLTQPDIAAVFGSYDAHPADPHTVSRFRNLLHHYVHQVGSPDAATFWTGCSALRRSIFQSVGPFNRVSITCIEDIDYGHRLRDAGHRVLLRPDIQGTHLKRWTLPGMIRTDFLQRGIPWTIMMLRRGRADNDLNLSARHRLSALAVLLGISALTVAAILLLLQKYLPAVVLLIFGLGALAALTLLQKRFYRYLLQLNGWGFLLCAIPLHALYYCYSGAALIAGWLIYLFRYRKTAKEIK